jgi:hypothetical protein
MAVIRCKLAENGKSVESAEIEFELGDRIQFGSGKQPDLAGDSSRELSVHVKGETLHVTFTELPSSVPSPPHNPKHYCTESVVLPDPGEGTDKPGTGPKRFVAILVPNAQGGFEPNPEYPGASKAKKAGK